MHVGRVIAGAVILAFMWPLATHLQGANAANNLDWLTFLLAAPILLIGIPAGACLLLYGLYELVEAALRRLGKR